MSDAEDQQLYIVHPTYTERVDENGDSIVFDADSLYDDLVLAGYPLTNDSALGGYYVDLAVRVDRVVVFTSCPAVEHDMGPVGSLFLSWQVLNDIEAVA
jgi:hypothetical protein